jgi:dienelactone hydrolase
VYLATRTTTPACRPSRSSGNAALDESGVRSRAEVYPDAPHGFAMADTTADREGAAGHFSELVALLDRALPHP